MSTLVPRDPSPEGLGAQGDFDLNDLRTPARAHFVGLGGSGMRALARVLLGFGWRITGSDSSPDRCRDLQALGLDVRSGHAASHLPDDVELVVASDAVPRENLELVQAAQLAIPTQRYVELLRRVLAGRVRLAVAGTHGKSTTTAMAAEILTVAGLDPTVVCGATPRDGSLLDGGRAGFGEVSLVEACEFRRNFLQLQPNLAVITGVEMDHVDCYASLDDLRESFEQFAASLPRDGQMLVRDECATARQAAGEALCSVETFGLSEGADWQATELHQDQGCYSFTITYRGDVLGEATLKVPGRHNLLNALAAAALAYHAGASAADICCGLEKFAGLRRRLESWGNRGGVALWDDYAHHPSEVAATIAALREIHPGRRIWAIFQPHQESRTASLLDEFAQSLNNADRVTIAPVFRARESSDSPPRVTAEILAGRVRALGTEASQWHNLEEIVREIEVACCPGDVLVTMGAGDIEKVIYDITNRI